jgi:hypothetical protein
MNTSARPRVVGRFGIAGWSMCAAVVLFVVFASVGRADDSGWTVVSENLDSFRESKENWSVCGEVKLDPDNARKLATEAGQRRVELNGVVIHENQEAACPTGAAWHNAEHDKGPVLLQGDHGPVAFRNIRIRPL